MNHRILRLWVTVASLLGLLALLLTGCAPAAPVLAPTATPAAAVAASTGLSTLHFFYTDW